MTVFQTGLSNGKKILMVLYLNTSDVRMAFHVRYVKIDDVEEENEFTR